jgi:hypothetical protein
MDLFLMSCFTPGANEEAASHRVSLHRHRSPAMKLSSLHWIFYRRTCCVWLMRSACSPVTDVTVSWKIEQSTTRLAKVILHFHVEHLLDLGRIRYWNEVCLEGTFSISQRFSSDKLWKLWSM